MDNVHNPYTPNAGATPEALIGRDGQTEAFIVLLERLRRGRTEQSMIITGLRGVGKTVLLNKFSNLAEDAGWEVIDLEASKHDEHAFRQAIFSKFRTALLHLSPRQRWTDRARHAAAVLSSFALSMNQEGTFSVSWDVPPSDGYGDHGDLGLDLTDIFLAVGAVAKEKKTGIVLLIDEVQFLTTSQLESLIQAVHKAVQKNLPITLVGAGLPQIAELAGDAKSYAERLFTFPRIDSLGPADARRALIEPAHAEGVVFTEDAAALAVSITHGYPYFLQELGYQAWIIAKDARIERADILAAREAYEVKLDNSFFKVRLDRATPLQIAYMRAMAELGPEPQKAADVAALMGRESPQVAPIRSQLIDMGLLYTPQHGYAAFTVPDFDAFMLRAVPKLQVPQPRSSRRGR
ncbi:Predicted ATPase (AAA+ superfamily) [Actinomyces bovis]|uniref:Predicted ATPase (AAA+ superfamily) n=1 Tax=Actinomyces bovis TaxID=1658 RepID=A0ABY1VLX6_9ACTO|nr:ATP-binding protein [Actinomyces bovis]SPT53015.1 Predicted ATPase (AAA+ superfamily) [Actinomyces bovis]VEG55270.1 Predicted ATPase (AAA+ superfamily) [Actinomyces israelii]